MLNTLIQWFIRKKREALRQSYKRVLSVNELFSDRWEKARYLGFGEKAAFMTAPWCMEMLQLEKIPGLDLL